jgi:hypothetical protein
MLGFFRADPASGYKFSKITVNGTTYTTFLTPTMTFDKDVTVIAYFESTAPTKVNVKMEVRPSGAGTIRLYRWVVVGIPIADTTSSTTVQVDKGMQGYFNAYPASGYKLIKITVDGKEYYGYMTPTMTFDKDVTAIAYFEAGAPPIIPTAKANVSLSVSPSNSGTITLYKSDGSVLGSTTSSTTVQVDKGTSCYLKADPASGYKFTKFTIDGREDYSNPTSSFVVDKDISATAAFEQAPPAKPPEEKRPPEEEKPWWERTYYGLPLWAWIAIGAGGAAAIGAVAYAEEKRREELMFILMGRR